MSGDNPMAWASSQPMWVQVVIGLTVFFMGLPLLAFAISELFIGFSSLMIQISTLFSRDHKKQFTSTNCEQIRPLDKEDEVLLEALHSMYPERSAESLTEYLAGKTSAEKAYLVRSPRIAQAIEELEKEPVASNP